MSWIIVTKNKGGDRFYPVHQLRQKLKAKVVPHNELRNRGDNFWKNKHVIFHMVWKQEYMPLWVDHLERVASNAKTFWVEFDADQYMNNLERFDKTCGYPDDKLVFWNKVTPYNLIWELPINYLPMEQYQRTIVNLGLYDVKWERPIKNQKSIDVFAVIDSIARNGTYTLYMLEQLQKSLKVVCIVNNRRFYNYYKDKTSIELIHNTKFSSGSEKKFHEFLRDSKVYVEFSNRITLGRNIYEALFNGCLAVTPNTYGVSQFFPKEFVIDPNFLNFDLQRETLLHKVGTYQKQRVHDLRQQVKEKADINRSIKELKEKRNG